MQVHRVVQVDAGQDREHIGLQEGHEDLQRGDRHGHGERQDRRQDEEGRGDGEDRGQDEGQAQLVGQRLQLGQGAALGLVVGAEGFEGPLDFLLEMVRRQRVDLGRLSILLGVLVVLAIVVQIRPLARVWFFSSHSGKR